VPDSALHELMRPATPAPLGYTRLVRFATVAFSN
jgi:hypothetical protein